MGRSYYVVGRAHAQGRIEILGREEDMRRLQAVERAIASLIEAHGREPQGARAIELRDLRALEDRHRETITGTYYPSAKAAFRRIDQREREEAGGRRPDPWDHAQHRSARGWRVWRLSWVAGQPQRELVHRDGAPEAPSPMVATSSGLIVPGRYATK